MAMSITLQPWKVRVERYWSSIVSEMVDPTKRMIIFMIPLKDLEGVTQKEREMIINKLLGLCKIHFDVVELWDLCIKCCVLPIAKNGPQLFYRNRFLYAVHINKMADKLETEIRNRLDLRMISETTCYCVYLRELVSLGFEISYSNWTAIQELLNHLHARFADQIKLTTTIRVFSNYTGKSIEVMLKFHWDK